MDVSFSLELESAPASVQLVRSVVRTVGQAAALDQALLDDALTAISEACNNVVLHAYPLGGGPLLFRLSIGEDRLQAVVRDHGSGIQGAPSCAGGLGMGVTVISALADQVDFETGPGAGTEVRMIFRRRVPSPALVSSLIPGALTLPAPAVSAAPRARSG